MLQQYKILTITHKQVNLKRLSTFAISSDELEEKLAEGKALFGLSEIQYLATCNRVMYFFVAPDRLSEQFVRDFLVWANPALADEPVDHLLDDLQLLEGMEAIDHLFAVAASLDSLVIGERQILRQLRESFEQCRTWGLTGPWIQLAFQQAQLAAKKIYTDTRIGEKPVSVVSLAMQKLQRHNLPRDARILLIGAGQTNSLVAKFLVKHEFTNVTVFNRTLSRARQLAKSLNGSAFPLEDLKTYGRGFDCMIVCTGSREAVIGPEVYHRLLAGETGPKVLIDLSVPHNIATDVVERYPVHYIEIEGLRQLAKENLAFREQEVEVARQQLDELLAAFPQIVQQRSIELAMRLVPDEIKAVRAKALNEVFRKEMDHLDHSTQELISRMLEYMEKKCIGIPMRAARTAVLPES